MRSSSAASAHASSTSVPGSGARCRSACSAILVRSGSTTTSLPPLRFDWRIAAHQMQVGDGRVVAPHHVQLCIRGEVPAGSLAPRHRCRPTPRCARRRTSSGDTAASRPAGGRTATTCCRRPACRAGRHSSAASPPARPTARSPRRYGRGSHPVPVSQVMRSNVPEPFGPVRRNGCRMRCGPCTNAGMSRATLLQMTPAVNGAASEPRTFAMRPSSTDDAEAAGVRAVEGADAGAFDDGHRGNSDTTVIASAAKQSPARYARRWRLLRRYASRNDTGTVASAVPIASAGARPSRTRHGGRCGISTVRSDWQGRAGDRRQPRHRPGHRPCGGRGGSGHRDLGHQCREERRGAGRAGQDRTQGAGAAVRCRRRGGGRCGVRPDAARRWDGWTAASPTPASAAAVRGRSWR